MKVLSDNASSSAAPIATNTFELPQGLIGFKDYVRAELLYLPDHLPFLWMRLHNRNGKDAVHFIVIEPAGLIPNYAPELFDADAEGMDIKNAGEAMLLNIVTMHQQRPTEATVNLVGPIVVNRRTKAGRQLVISNYSQYSAHWPLVDNSAATTNLATA